MVYFPVYHPAAALYQGSLRDVLLRDMEKLPVLLQQIREGGRMLAAESSTASPDGQHARPEASQGELF